MKSKTIIIFILVIITLTSACTNNDDNNDDNNNNNNNDDNSENDDENTSYDLKKFNECLAEQGLIIYGSEWCAACKSLIQTLGGYEAVQPIYIECMEQQEKCAIEKQTNYVPEIQFLGKVYEGQRTIEALAQLTGCKEPN
jgi:thioredoxin-related protein